KSELKDIYPDDIHSPVLKAVIEKTNTNPATEAEDVDIRSALESGSQRLSESELAAFYAGFHSMSINLDI
ncbi:hypothetical protein Tco_0637910, partial [Tanacetum coccineum]